MTNEKTIKDEIEELAGALIRIARGDAPQFTLDIAEQLCKAARAAAQNDGEQEKLALYLAAIMFNISLAVHGA